jgi:HK97 family phage prohead protease
MDYSAYHFELKTMSDAGLIEGIASGYGNIDAGRDIVAYGAFTDSIAEHAAKGTAPAMLLYHDPSRPAGRWESFTETPKGLIATGQLALNASDGKEAYSLLKAKALTGLSVGYAVKDADFGTNRVRTIKKADLWEVSMVTFPMNDRARVTSVKSIGNVRDIEELLRSAGISGRKAKAGASAAWRAINESECDQVAGEALAAILTQANQKLAIFNGETK